MTADRFRVVGESLVGRGLSFDVALFRASGAAKKDFDEVLANVAEVAYRQGRDSVLLPYDDRFDLHCTVEALRALSVIVGPSATGDRYRRSGGSEAHSGWMIFRVPGTEFRRTRG